MQTLVGHSDVVTSAVFSADGPSVPTGSRDMPAEFGAFQLERECRHSLDALVGVNPEASPPKNASTKK